MTNSAKPNSDSTDQPVLPGYFEAGLGIAGLVVGWVLILRVGHWHFTVSTFFLFCGWAAVVMVIRYLWDTAVAATRQDEEFAVVQGRREDLLREKRSLLKAIKEIEFDHQMGKMSDADATEITRLYRTRAIEVIKGLEGKEGKDKASGGSAPSAEAVREEIEREVERRLGQKESGA